MDDKEQALRQFVEDIADVLDEYGFSHMAGRVIGSLLVCVPPQQSLDELADGLQASRGSISMATQLLVRLGVIEKVSIPGERRHFHRVRSDFWLDIVTQKQDQIDRHREAGEAGLRLLVDEPLESKKRLLEMLAFLDFATEETPGFVERWRERRETLVERRVETIA